jgi:hypothetical protein
MWLPKNEADIINAVNSGALEETDVFDAKKEVSKNQEVAKDVAAMANNGGVIIYGIGEDELGRLTQLTPIPLQGLAERVDAIVRSSISEPPSIYISSIPTEADPSVGYLVVFIPPSERAPHMVVVKNDHRFYGRSATGNYPLSEGDVARLYARRQQTEVNREALLDAEIKTSPYPPNQNYGYMFLYARPVFYREMLLGSILKNGETFPGLLNSLIEAASRTELFPQGSIYPDFRTPRRWIQYAEGFQGLLSEPGKTESPEAPGETLSIQVDLNGMIHMFCGRVAEKYEDRLLFLPEVPSGLILRFLTFIGFLYERAKYIGMVDLGLAITGIQGCLPHMPNLFRFERIAVPYIRDEYRKTTRVSGLLIKDDAKQIAQELIMPLINAITLNRSKPFENKSQ